jgi:hypothetical protein
MVIFFGTKNMMMNFRVRLEGVFKRQAENLYRPMHNESMKCPLEERVDNHTDPKTN